MKGSGGVEGSGLRQRGASVGPGEVEAAHDDREGDAFRACLSIHVALVVVGHAIGGAGEVWFSLTAVSTLTHRLAVPDITLGPLLGAHETRTGGFFGHPNRAFLPIHITGSHTTSSVAYILATFLKGLTHLQDKETKRDY